MRVLLLPCDTRPPTLELPHQLARVAGVELLSPPLEILNRLNQPGDAAAIADWLRREAPPRTRPWSPSRPSPWGA